MSKIFIQENEIFKVGTAVIAEYNHAMKKYRTVFDKEETLEDLKPKFHKCIRQFFEYSGKNNLTFPYEELLKEDCIDVTRTIDHTQLTGPTDYPAYKVEIDEKEYFESHPYCIFSPIKSGVIKINKGRWIQFNSIPETMVIQDNLKSMEYLLQDYRIDKKLAILDRAISVIISWNNGNISYESSGRITMNNVLVSEPGEKIFDNKDLLFWNIVVLPKIKQTINNEKQGINGEPYMDNLDWHMVNSFTRSIIFTNYQLSKSKATANRKASSKIIAVPDQSGKKPKKQLIRNVGGTGITITSIDIPKEANEDRVIKYRIASWNTRGHERKLKSGKVVWVRQSVHHRKCLEKTDPLRTEIQIREVTA